MIRTCALQSGSNGNCIYVETDDARLIFDAGISARRASERLARHNRDLHDVNAIIISHNHSDHSAKAGVFHRKISCPVYITKAVWQDRADKLGKINPDSIRHFSPGQCISFGNTYIQTIPTPHDGIDTVAFAISCGNSRLGIFTDLGHCFAGIEDWIAQLDAVYLESNYDPDMLANGPYPAWLRERIAGDAGHLSNTDAAELAYKCRGRLKLLILSHLSEHNNTPGLALRTARRILDKDISVVTANRYDVSPVFDV